jgi:hypothetical protein
MDTLIHIFGMITLIVGGVIVIGLLLWGALELWWKMYRMLTGVPLLLKQVREYRKEIFDKQGI